MSLPCAWFGVDLLHEFVALPVVLQADGGRVALEGQLVARHLAVGNELNHRGGLFVAQAGRLNVEGLGMRCRGVPIHLHVVLHEDYFGLRIVARAGGFALAILKMEPGELIAVGFAGLGVEGDAGGLDGHQIGRRLALGRFAERDLDRPRAVESIVGIEERGGVAADQIELGIALVVDLWKMRSSTPVSSLREESEACRIPSDVNS